MRVYVTQKDINNGIRMNKHSCPIALSLKRRGFQDVYVGMMIICVDDQPYYYLSNKVKDFIYDFDKDVLVKPFSFTFPYEPEK